MNEITKVAKLTVYRDHAGEWRWAAKGHNGRTLADSGEGYLNHADAMKIAADLFPGAEITQDERPADAVRVDDGPH